MCSGRRRSSSSWRRRKRRRPRLRRIFAAVELLHSSVTLLVSTSLEVKLKCTRAFFFLGVSLASYCWSFFPFLSLTGLFFCVFFYETPKWNFVSPNGVIDRALGFLFLCSGRRRSSSWRRRKRRRPRLRRIFAAVELLHFSVTLLFVHCPPLLKVHGSAGT